MVLARELIRLTRARLNVENVASVAVSFIREEAWFEEMKFVETNADIETRKHSTNKRLLVDWNGSHTLCHKRWHAVMKEEVVGEDMNEWRKIQLQVEKALCDYGAIRQTQIKKYRERTASIIQLKQEEVRQSFMKLGQRQSYT